MVDRCSATASATPTGAGCRGSNARRHRPGSGSSRPAPRRRGRRSRSAPDRRFPSGRRSRRRSGAVVRRGCPCASGHVEADALQRAGDARGRRAACCRAGRHAGSCPCRSPARPVGGARRRRAGTAREWRGRVRRMGPEYLRVSDTGWSAADPNAVARRKPNSAAWISRTLRSHLVDPGREIAGGYSRRASAARRRSPHGYCARPRHRRSAPGRKPAGRVAVRERSRRRRSAPHSRSRRRLADSGFSAEIEIVRRQRCHARRRCWSASLSLGYPGEIRAEAWRPAGCRGARTAISLVLTVMPTPWAWNAAM